MHTAPPPGAARPAPGGGGHGQAPGTEPTASPLKRASNLATAPLQILTKPHKTTDKKRFKNSM